MVGCCASDDQCDDGNACTTNTCAGNACVTTPVAECCAADSDCDDGSACTTDSCGAGGSCANVAVAGCCIADATCEDGDPCTANSCAASVCVSAPVAGCCASDAECEDGNACTTSSCVANTCTSAPVLGCCVSDAECEDDNACTTTACAANTCVATPVPDCCSADSDCDDADPCTDDSCGAGGSCANVPSEACCSADDECDDGDACTTDACAGGECSSSPIAGCCATDADCNAEVCATGTCSGGACSYSPIPGCCTTGGGQCDDGDECTADSCGAGNQCVHAPIAGCCTELGEVEAASFSFEPDTTDGVTPAPAVGPYRWREHTGEFTGGTASLYFGNSSGDHYCPQFIPFAPSGTATMPNGSGSLGAIVLPPSTPASARFDARLDIRSAADVDTFVLQVLVEGADPVDVWSKADIDASQYGSWVPVEVDLSAFAGSTIRLRFAFAVQTHSGCYQGGAGPRIDELRVHVVECGTGCQHASDCNDGAACTEDLCLDGECQHIPASTPVMSFVFDETVEGWSPDPSSGAFRWRETDGDFTAAPMSMYFGNSGASAYCSLLPTIPAASGVANLPGLASDNYPTGTISFGATGQAVLSFDLKLDVRDASNRDLFEVRLIGPDGDAVATVFTKASVPDTLYGHWVPVVIDLSAYAPFTGSVQFFFDTVDKFGGGSCFLSDGVFVDEVRIDQFCPEG